MEIRKYDGRTYLQTYGHTDLRTYGFTDLHTSLLVSFSVALDTKTKQTNKSVFSQAFEANASSSGGIQTLIDIHISQDDKITTFYELQK